MSNLNTLFKVKYLPRPIEFCVAWLLQKPSLMPVKNSLFIILCVLGYSHLLGQNTKFVVPLWPNGAPGFENRKNEPQFAKDWYVNNIHNPSITVFKAPDSIANGSSVVICPGGGFRNLGFNGEGVEAAKFLNKLGVTAFVLKYRLFRQEGSPYKEEHAWQDIFRAMRLVRSRAADFGIDSNKVGVMGFSAGGETAGWVSYHYNETHSVEPDAVDTYSAKPAFQILIYPGPLAVPHSVTSSAPPTLMVVANDDACCSEPVVELLRMHRKANVPVEVHLYAQGDHAFNMGYRTPLVSVKGWPQRMADWLADNILNAKN
jgi:acetyl esterase/lipase